MSDERKSRPSASLMWLLHSCHGSWRVIQAMRAAGARLDDDEPGQPPEYLLAGLRVHDYMREPTPEKWDKLSTDDRWMAHRLEYLWDLAIKETKISGDTLKEQRLWSPDGRYSGQLDVGVMDQQGGWAVVGDYKTGRVEVTQAPSNHQLRTIAVLMSDNYGVSRVFVGIFQPRAEMESTLCLYDKDDIARAREELSQLMDAIEKPDAPLTAGEWCGHCPARSMCPVNGKQMAMTIARKMGDVAVKDFVALLTPEEMSGVATFMHRGRALFDAVEERMKSMIEADKDAIPGWRVTDKVECHPIGDASKAYGLVSEYLSPDEFAAACRVSFEALDEVFHKKSGCESKRQSAILLRKILAPALITTVKRGSLKMAKS